MDERIRLVAQSIVHFAIDRQVTHQGGLLP
jgi:hypothetical protein